MRLVYVILLLLCGAAFAEEPGLMQRTGRAIGRGAKATGEYLYNGVTTLGPGFVVRRATDEEIHKLNEAKFHEMWFQKEKPFSAKKIFHNFNVYQWPVRAISRFTHGEQYYLTPGKGLAFTLDYLLCSRVVNALFGPRVMTGPARLTARLTPVMILSTYTLNRAQEEVEDYVEYRIQGPLAPGLDEEIETAVYLKPIKSAHEKGELSREDARRRAYAIRNDLKAYFKKVETKWPKDEDPQKEKDFIKWSLKQPFFEDIANYVENPRIQMDTNRYLYPEDFIPVIDIEQIKQLTYERHLTLMKARGADILMQIAMGKRKKGSENGPARRLKEEPLVQEVLKGLEANKITEKEAKKFLNSFLFWQLELANCEIFGVARKARFGDEYINEPVSLDEIREDLLEAVKQATKP